MADNQNLVQQLFTELEEKVFFGDQLRSREFVTLMSPGQFVSDKLSANNLDDLYTQWEITDDKLDTSFLRRPLNGSISGLLREIDAFKVLPETTLSNQERERLDKIKKQLGRKLPAYRAYQQVWEDIDRQLRGEMNKRDGDPVIIVDLRRKKRSAQEDWEQYGSKNDVEALQAERLLIIRNDPKLFWKEEISDRLEDHKSETDRGEFWETWFYPPVAEWKESSWTTYDLSIKDKYDYSYSRSTSWSAGFGASWGLWHVGGSGGRSETYSHDISQLKELKIKFDVLRVRIQRPWFNANLFNWRFWTWNKDTHGFTTISDGGDLTADPPVRPIAPLGLPFVPDEMFVIRNLVLSGNFSKEDRTLIEKHINGRAGFGWGPFSISGSYREDTKEKTFYGSYANSTITVGQPQIFAFCGALTPKCPNPLRTLAWGKNAAFEDDPAPAEVALSKLAHEEEYLRVRMRGLRASKLEEVRDLSTATYERISGELREMARDQIGALARATAEVYAEVQESRKSPLENNEGPASPSTRRIFEGNELT